MTRWQLILLACQNGYNGHLWFIPAQHLFPYIQVKSSPLETDPPPLIQLRPMILLGLNHALEPVIGTRQLSIIYALIIKTS